VELQDDYVKENLSPEEQKEEAKTETAATFREDDEEIKDQHDPKFELTLTENHIDNSTEPSTIVPEKKKVSNRFELFEKLLTFLDTTDELNPVLSGYFSKLFQVLVGNKTKEVFTYIYNHPHVLDMFVRHIY
jgi:hypothetical protein